MPIPIENRIYRVNFFGAGGTPDGQLIALSGIEYTDVDDRIRYRQITIPHGTRWVAVATEVLVAIVAKPTILTYIGL
jgi:hypothetical protein